MKYVEIKNSERSEVPNDKEYRISEHEWDKLYSLRKRLNLSFNFSFENSNGIFIIPKTVLREEDYNKLSHIEFKELNCDNYTQLHLMRGPCIRCCLWNERTECICKNECEYCYDEDKCYCAENEVKRLDNAERSTSIFCRSCGPGGTTVNIKAMEQGLRCVWTHEDLPYLFESEDEEDKVTADEESVASDGHNISWLTYKKNGTYY